MVEERTTLAEDPRSWAEATNGEVQRKMPKKYPAEEKVRIVLERL